MAGENHTTDDRKKLDEVLDSFLGLDDRYVVVGVPQGAKERDGDGDATMAEVAFYNEFGTKNKDGDQHIPERSFLRSAMDENADKYAKYFVKLMRAVIDEKMDTDKALGILGQMGKADVDQKIRSNIPPPNAESTIKKKGRKIKSTKTLIDTGQLRQSITYEVRRGKPTESERDPGS